MCVLQGALSERLSRPAGNSFSERIAGSAAQIFENLVGREVEVVLTRFGLPPARDGERKRDQAFNSSVT